MARVQGWGVVKNVLLQLVIFLFELLHHYTSPPRLYGSEL